MNRNLEWCLFLYIIKGRPQNKDDKRLDISKSMGIIFNNAIEKLRHLLLQMILAWESLIFACNEGVKTEICINDPVIDYNN